MMRSSIVSLERAMGTDAEGQPASRNAYVTTGRGGPINVDLSQLWRRQAAARYDVNANVLFQGRRQMPGAGNKPLAVEEHHIVERILEPLDKDDKLTRVYQETLEDWHAES